MTIHRTLVLALIGLAYGLTTWLFPFILPEEIVAGLVQEDSVPEYLGALFFLLSGLAWLAAFFVSRTGNQIGKFKTRRNYIYLALALILLFGGMEEISWGQRILGFETPEFMEANEQEEFSIHNLPEFNTTNVSNLFQMNRMFIYFWFGFGILIPLSAMASPVLRRFYLRLGVPVVPLIIGGQFLLNYILSKLYGPLGVVRDSYGGRISELRESQQEPSADRRATA
ncbi:MAG: hypothetical protein Kow0077_00060 [Anaerolineae bacterium]